MKDKWNQFYDKHGRYYLTPHEGLNRFINRLKHFEVKRVLDLGCGTGRHIVPLAEAGFSVVGIDISPSAAALAEKWLLSKNLGGKVFVSDLHEKISFIEESSEDAILAICSMQYTNIEQFKKTIKEINRILRTGGLFFLVVPSKETIISDLNIEQIFFEEDQIKEIINNTFRVLEFRRDSEKNFVIVAQEK